VPLLEVVELFKEFPTPTGPAKRAVDGVGFHVNAGEIYGLLGPNGAGQDDHTADHLGIDAATAGRAIVNGVDVTVDPSSVRGSIGFLTASTGLYQRLTAREVLVTSPS